MFSPTFRLFISSIGFLSDAYDLFVINMVKRIMAHDYHQSSGESGAVSSAALIGAICGQLFFGGLADKLGRRLIFVVTLWCVANLWCESVATMRWDTRTVSIPSFPSCVTLGSFGSATVVESSHLSIYTQLALWRFLLGLGVGGEYPLSATITSETSDAQSRGSRVSAVFAMQGVGNVMAAVACFGLLNSGLEYEYVWRIALALGGVPGLLTVYWRWKMEETEAFQREHPPELADDPSAIPAGAPLPARPSWREGVKEITSTMWEFRKVLLGTAGAWFIFDITFYANGLFSAAVLEAVGIGHHEDLVAIARSTIYVALIGLPGYIVAVLTIDRIGRKRMQMSGFFLVGALFVVLAAFLRGLEDHHQVTFVFIYGLTFFFANFGPNTTTFVIPSESFPTRARATCHGFSAASGKAGAVLGGVTLRPLMLAWGRSPDAVTQGLRAVLYVCAAISICGMVWTKFFVQEHTGEDLEAVEHPAPGWGGEVEMAVWTGEEYPEEGYRRRDDDTGPLVHSRDDKGRHEMDETLDTGDDGERQRV